MLLFVNNVEIWIKGCTLTPFFFYAKRLKTREKKNNFKKVPKTFGSVKKTLYLCTAFERKCLNSVNKQTEEVWVSG